MPPPASVAAVPLALLDYRRRTHDPDDWARSAARGLDDVLATACRGGVGGAASPGRGAAVLVHVARSFGLAAATTSVGLALLLAGGAVGTVVLALLASGTASDIGVDAAAELLAGALGLAAAPGSPVARPDADPHAVAALAALLDDDVLAALARTRPHLVGPVDGMPIALRYEANRVIALGSDDEAVRRLGAPGRQLLYVDPGRGHAAEVVGDLLAAEHIAVVVPGMANDIAGFATVLDKAEALRRAAAALDPPADVAAIAWLGYDSPSVDVVLDDAARAGAPHLARFVDGLGAGGVAADVTRTVVGHSYGSVVTGLALRHGLAADAVAVTGSPGLGAGSADELGHTPIYALRAPGDYVGWTEAFGTDPTDADFGATRLATGDVVGHSGYFDAGTVALRSLALVAADRAGEAHVLERSWFEIGANVFEDVRMVGVDAPIDTYQDVMRVLAGDGAAVEVANRGVDFLQRLTSPDLGADLAEDAWRWAVG